MPKGGARPGAGAKLGSKQAKTIEKEAARALLRQMVYARLPQLVNAQLASAEGIAHFMLRDPESGQFQRLTDPDQIQAALNAPNAAEGSTYYIFTKDPSIQAFTDLANRALDKPVESVDMNISGDAELLAKLHAARKRVGK